jgi:DnaK suppressor protein
MTVSILQLGAIPIGGAAVARPGENPSRERRERDNQGITRTHDSETPSEQRRTVAAWHSHAGAAAARRLEVKPQSKVGAKPGKPAAKAKAKVKAAPAKPAHKPVKPAAKANMPAATRSAAKAPAKKAPAKPAKKAAAGKPAAKPAAKKASGQKTTARKAPAAVKTAAKKAAPAAKAKPVAKHPAAKTKTGAAKAPGANVPAQPRAMPPRPDAASVTAEPARATKPSARLAQITVPSMAQSVASTAAKASYSQTMSPSVLTPPPLVAIKKDPKLANNWKAKTVEQLTDAEVLAMPDSEYMNEKQMGFFRLKLTQLKQDILNNAGVTTEHLREDTVIVPDPADRATIEEEHALELRTRDRERKLLKKIEQSIARIDAGDYGYCDETGEPIGVGRLLARPTATLSLEAQQRRELKQKMFGD